MNRRHFLTHAGGVVALCARLRGSLRRVFDVAVVPFESTVYAQQSGTCTPGWTGSLLIDCDSTTDWIVETDAGSSGSLQLTPGLTGQAIRLNWNLGSGSWVQGKHTFTTERNLSAADIFGITLRGGGITETPNTVAIMFADANDVFYGFDMAGSVNGINQIDRWMINLSFPKKALWFFFNFGEQTTIDWSRITRFFIVVKRPAGSTGGGSGQLSVDQVRFDTAAQWSRQTQFSVVAPNLTAAQKAIAYILTQQKPTGLFVSWKEEEIENPPPKAWLYDQALALLALTREGSWLNGAPHNAAAQAAKSLADFLVGAQKSDGHWARSWNPVTSAELVDDGWVGDQAWCTFALADYARRSAHVAALSAAWRAASWLALKIDSAGKVVNSTEGTVDVWWAMVATTRFADANRIKTYLLSNVVWDSELLYWWRGSADPVIAMDAATWLSSFARHPLVGQTARGMAALSFVKRTLVTQSPDSSEALCGFDSMGPISIWNEGTAQYVTAGGEDAQARLGNLVSQQHADGSMPGGPESRSTDTFGWLTTWSGLSSTAWLYFANAGSPFAGLPFTDDPIVAGSTTIKAVHIAELRNHVAALRARYNLGTYSYTTDVFINVGTTIRAQHILELRAALADAYSAALRTPPTYTPPDPIADGAIQAANIAELRAAVVAL